MFPKSSTSIFVHHASLQCKLLCFFQVQALKFGHVLVIDEADKAPINVTCVLKTLVENGEMVLGDGRRVVPGMTDAPYEPITTLSYDLGVIWGQMINYLRLNLLTIAIYCQKS